MVTATRAFGACDRETDVGDALSEKTRQRLLTLRRREARACQRCDLWTRATQTVFGEGDVGARLMLVGEQPGDQEDLRGQPFQGPAGQLLRDAIAELGWPGTALYLTNAVKHFHHELRGKRRLHKTPGQREADACLHWLEAEIAAVRPQALVALVAREIDFLFDSISGSGALIDAGKLRALAVATNKRLSQLPDVPTLTEVGLKLVLGVWLGLFAPKGTPRPVLDQWAQYASDYFRDADVRSKLLARGIEPIPSTPQEFARQVSADEAQWRPLIKSLNIQT